MKSIPSKIFSLLLFSICSLPARAQLIDYYSASKQVSDKKYFRLHYDNDYFTDTDEYYTQGITFEYANPGIKHFFLSKLLWKPYRTEAVYGVTFNLWGYTPTSILSDHILYGDRPFDADISAEIFSIQKDELHRQQISTALDIGVMGPLAQGEEIQRGIHKATGNPLPHGWQYQVQNDVILNYRLSYEKQLLAVKNNLLINLAGEARAGTLNDHISGGLNLLAGRFNKKFSTGKKRYKAEYYFFSNDRVTAVGYDATLQGGLFNRHNPYIISANDISRITFRSDMGIAVRLKNFYISYSKSLLSKEFVNGKRHKWGGVGLGFGF